jgi:RimJ/RimL family protein N-acetyltransferase
MGLQRVNLDVEEGNLRARRSYEKVGFRRIGQHFGLDGHRYIDMEISRREFFAKHGRPAANEAGTPRRRINRGP